MKFEARKAKNGSYYISLDETVRTKILPIRNAYGMIGARLCGLNYTQYLQYIERECGARILDPNGSGYFFTFEFMNLQKLQAHVDELNSRWDALIEWQEEQDIPVPKSLSDF